VAPEPLDQRVVDDARAGEGSAVERVLRHHQPTMYALCRRVLGNDADAADATQEAMIAVVRGLPRFDGRSALSTWIYRVTTNAALDEVRRRRRRPLISDDVDRGAASGDGVDPADRGGPALDDTVADRLRLDAALDSLSPEFRTVVVLRDVIGLDYAEIAAVLDLAPGTVRSRISRGRSALARALDPRPDPTPARNLPAADDVTPSDAP
jgi:RNA polymerase sigma-70 factor (ECF subfamily)